MARPKIQAASPLEKEKAEAELENLHLTNAELRQKLRLALAGFVITSLVAVGSHWGEIKSIFVSKPRTTLAVHTNDPFLRDLATLQIDGGEKQIRSDLAKAGSVELAPGAHTIKVLIGDTAIFSTDVALQSGKQRNVDLPDDLLRRIHVAVTGAVPQAHAEESMEITVNASGAGYAWIFRTDSASTCSLAFPFHPDGSPLSSDENFVAPNRKLTFPRPSRDGAVHAPVSLGPAKLYVIVTSVNDLTQATGIVSHYCNVGTAKAAAPDLRDNWGIEEVPFAVI